MEADTGETFRVYPFRETGSRRATRIRHEGLPPSDTDHLRRSCRQRGLLLASARLCSPLSRSAEGGSCCPLERPARTLFSVPVPRNSIVSRGRNLLSGFELITIVSLSSRSGRGRTATPELGSTEARCLGSRCYHGQRRVSLGDRQRHYFMERKYHPSVVRATR